MSDILVGNLDQDKMDNPQRRGWFLGYFMDQDSEFYSKDFEVKWGKHEQGYKKKGVGKNRTAKSISILVKGKVKIAFPEQNKETLLENEGDYVYFSPGIGHTFEALEQSITITFRWPSIKDDQIVDQLA